MASVVVRGSIWRPGSNGRAVPVVSLRHGELRLGPDEFSWSQGKYEDTIAWNELGEYRRYRGEKESARGSCTAVLDQGRAAGWGNAWCSQPSTQDGRRAILK